MSKKEEYYEAVQKLRYYEKRKEREGGNYCTDMGIQKYQQIVDELSNVPKNPKLKIEKFNPLTKREWNDLIRKKVKLLGNRIKRGQATWQDIFVYDVWTKQNKEEWRLPI
jgi:hypothetical protein